MIRKHHAVLRTESSAGVRFKYWSSIWPWYVINANAWSGIESWSGIQGWSWSRSAKEEL